MNPDPKKYDLHVAYGRTRTVEKAIKRWRKARKAKGCLKDSVHPKRPRKQKNIFE